MKNKRTYPHPCGGTHRNHLTRRNFLRSAGLAAVALAAAGCQTSQVVDSSQITNPKATVAIAQAKNYDRKLIRKQVEAMLDGIGGISDVLAHGNRVAIKTNLTGGTSVAGLPGIKEVDSYLTHPEVVRAVCELLRDAGAKELFIVEAVYEEESWPAYGYVDVAKDVGAKLIDLNNHAPYKDFAKVAPGTDKPVYEDYLFNPILNEIDAFVSISKMKCHNNAGVTHTLKNSFGLVPFRFYTLSPDDYHRSALHGPDNEAKNRVPKVIIDLNKARPINLSIIDGVLTTEAGEGPWISALTPIKPGVLFAGKDPVATDSIATAAMGFDPLADFPNEPFVNGINHLNLAAKAGMGTNRLDEIKVVGAKLKDVTVKFTTSF
jgi:uncharacterized protein (DUF362 family)